MYSDSALLKWGKLWMPLFLFLNGCGSGSNSSQENKVLQGGQFASEHFETGYFLGLRGTVPLKYDITDNGVHWNGDQELGFYRYVSDSPIHFSLGPFPIGSTSGSSAISVLDLFNTEDVNDQRVVNFSRLANALVGLPAQLDVTGVSQVNFDQSLSAFESDSAVSDLLQNNGVSELISAADAMEIVEKEVLEFAERPVKQKYKALTAIITGEDFACGLSSEVDCWGGNSHIDEIAMMSSSITAFDSNAEGICAVFNDQIECWGTNLSLPTVVSPSDIAITDSTACVIDQGNLVCEGAPGSIPRNNEPSLSGVSKIAAGFAHYCAIANGEVHCWGSNSNGQSTVPNGLVNPSQLALGDYFSCALTDNGVVCWGSEAANQGEVPDMSGVTSISAAGSSVCALHAGGVSCWGTLADSSFEADQLQNWLRAFKNLGKPNQIAVGKGSADYVCGVYDNGVSCLSASLANSVLRVPVAIAYLP